MNQYTAYRRYTWFVLIMVFLVILAGGVVRMTQSGMGCPDWPTCFGRWIPPLNKDQLPPDYEKYLRTQDIDHTFNVYHTWIEYINRLLGALLGMFIVFHFVWSVALFRKTKRSVIIISLLMLLAVGFQGWLGKKVVDANLAVVKVTIHMLMALVLAALPVWILSILNKDKVKVSKMLKAATVITLVIVLGQIVLGTDVREQIDEIAKPLGYGKRETWIAGLDETFLIHRSFSWIVTAACIYLYWISRSFKGLKTHGLLLLLFVGISIVAGLSLYYVNVPAIAQPIHLLSASLLAISLFSFRLRLN